MSIPDLSLSHQTVLASVVTLAAAAVLFLVWLGVRFLLRNPNLVLVLIATLMLGLGLGGRSLGEDVQTPLFFMGVGCLVWAVFRFCEEGFLEVNSEE